MKAKRQSECWVCFEIIDIDEEIMYAPGIGWIHKKCMATLDDPILQDDWHVRRYGKNVLTKQQRAIYEIQNPDNYDPYTTDIYGHGLGGPIDSDDLP